MRQSQNFWSRDSETFRRASRMRWTKKLAAESSSSFMIFHWRVDVSVSNSRSWTLHFSVTGSFFIVLLDTFKLNIVHSYILRCIWNMQNSSINVCIIYKIPYFKTGKLVAHYFYSPNLSTHARWRRSCQVWWAWRKCYCRLMHRKQSHCFFRATSFNCNGILYTHTHTHTQII